MMRTILRLNALSCIVFGVFFIAMPWVIADFLSANNPAPSWLVVILGVGLLANGAHLIWTSFQTTIARKWVRHFYTGDFIWVLATAVLIVSGLWITSLKGIVAAVLVAVFVGCIGVLQLKKSQELL
ncbi:MAG: hypothetical protein ACRBHB_09315 [Arenicella sp.]